MTRGDILVLDARESQEWQTSKYCYAAIQREDVEAKSLEISANTI